MTQKKEHPSTLQLAALVLGRLKAEYVTRIESHVSTCDDCRQYISNTPRDELAKIIRQAKQEPTVTQNPSKAHFSGAAAALKPNLEGDAPTRSLHANRSRSDGVSHAVTEYEIPQDLYNQSKYRIVRALGRGGMGTVYEAEHLRMRRRVAIKVINPEIVNHPQALARFEMEIKAVALLDHLNIARAFDAEPIGSLQAFVMEFVDGHTLHDHLKSHGQLGIVEACNYVQQALFGLQHAHEQGLVHRDLKPQNLMLTRATGLVKILDFGLAKAAIENRQTTGLTNTGSTMGTYAYMAPEQALDAAQADIRADIYSLGCTLYLLIAGKLPFDYGVDTRLLIAHQQETPRPLHEVRSDVPLGLSKLITRMLAKKPGERPRTPREASEELLPFTRSDYSIGDEMTVPLSRIAATHRSRNYRVAGILLAGISVLGFCGLAAGLFSVRTPAGTIVIDGLPDDADVTVDGQTVNVRRNDDTATIEAVSKGAHHLKVSQSGREVWSNDVSIGLSGDTMRVKFALPGEKIDSASASSPTGAENKTSEKKDVETAAGATGDRPTSPVQAKTAGAANNDFRQPIDLMPLIHLPEAVAWGNWIKTDTGYQSDKTSGAKLTFPIAATGEYDLRVTFTRVEGSGQVTIKFKYDDVYCWWYTGNSDMDAGAGFVYDKNRRRGWAGPLRSEKTPSFEVGVQYTALLRVRTHLIRGYIDDKLVSEWDFDRAEFGVPENFEVGPKDIYFMTTLPTVLHSAVLTPANVDGRDAAKR